MTEHDYCKKNNETETSYNYDKHSSISIPKPVVSIPECANQSRRGRLFVGQTDFLNFNYNCYAWGGLINPSDSRVNLFIDVFTISNFSGRPFQGQIWFNTRLPKYSHISNKVSPENTALCPLPEPKVKLLYASYVRRNPKGGVNPFLRIGEPYSTIVAEQCGRQIIPPGGNFTIILKSIEPYNRLLLAKIVFSWWEEKTTRSKL